MLSPLLDELARSTNGKVDRIPANLPVVIEAGDDGVSLRERGFLGFRASLYRKRGSFSPIDEKHESIAITK